MVAAARGGHNDAHRLLVQVDIGAQGMYTETFSSAQFIDKVCFSIVALIVLVSFLICKSFF